MTKSSRLSQKYVVDKTRHKYIVLLIAVTMLSVAQSGRSCFTKDLSRVDCKTIRSYNDYFEVAHVKKYF
jgi:hypothetical protein